MALLQFLYLLIISVFITNVYSHEYVPVYMWDTSKSYSPLPAQGRINEHFFRDILKDKVKKDAVTLVFLENNLSPEDFTTQDTVGESVFEFLSQVRQRSHVNYYPFVENPFAAIQKLSGVKIINIDGTQNTVPDVEVKSGDVVVVDLNDAKENEDRSHLLQRHDSLINSIYNSVRKNNDNMLALLTARHPSWLIPSILEKSENIRIARHVLAVEDNDDKNDYFFANSSTLLIFSKPAPSLKIENNTISFKGQHNIIENNATDFRIDVNGHTLIFSFNTSLGYWYFNKIEVSKNDSSSAMFNQTLNNIYAPFGFSYHCDKTSFVSSDKTLSFPGLQVELLHNKTASKFSPAYDCVGFTTAPIWSGLFVTFILALIMTFGLCMIMDIRTMDRFDDPKGKTISINVSE